MQQQLNLPTTRIVITPWQAGARARAVRMTAGPPFFGGMMRKLKLLVAMLTVGCAGQEAASTSASEAAVNSADPSAEELPESGITAGDRSAAQDWLREREEAAQGAWLAAHPDVPESALAELARLREQMRANGLPQGEEVTFKQGVVTGNPTDRYTLTVRTGSANNAGTDAHVFATIWSFVNGTWYSYNKNLNNPNRDDFERGSVDPFTISGVDLHGPVHYIDVWHDNCCGNPGWFLEDIVTVDHKRAITTTCDFDRWLSTGNWPFTIEASAYCQ